MRYPGLEQRFPAQLLGVSGLPLAYSQELQPRRGQHLRFVPAQDSAKELGLQLGTPPCPSSADWPQPALYLSLAVAETARFRAHRRGRRSSSFAAVRCRNGLISAGNKNAPSTPAANTMAANTSIPRSTCASGVDVGLDFRGITPASGIPSLRARTCRRSIFSRHSRIISASTTGSFGR